MEKTLICSEIVARTLPNTAYQWNKKKPDFRQEIHVKYIRKPTLVYSADAHCRKKTVNIQNLPHVHEEEAEEGRFL